MMDIRITLRGRAPRLPFEQMAQEVLDKTYELSLVVCGDRLARNMNRKYRNKTYAANVLSFPLSKTEGEIFLNMRASDREAKRYGVSRDSRLALLFVHGLMHLRGLQHGRTMEDAEQRILRRFKLASRRI